jgi:xanthine dehydrogenase accessory factor
MMDWMQSLESTHNQKLNYVVLSVVETKGSTPCRAGDKIIYTGQSPMFGSIGGGNLEYQALNHANHLLTQNTDNITIQKYPLGATLGQCCGGFVKIMFESFVNQRSDSTSNNTWLENCLDLANKESDFILATIVYSEADKYPMGTKVVLPTNQNNLNSKLENFPKEALDGTHQTLQSSKKVTMKECTLTDKQKIDVCYEQFSSSQLQSVAIFGAGHIARSLMPILTQLPIKVYWIDDRQSQFDEYLGDIGSIKQICDDFTLAINDLPKNTYCLVITYSHQIDFEICEKIIARNDFCYLGVIGSKIKGKRFRDRLRHKGWSDNLVSQLICPIGVKHAFLQSPISIAVSITSELLNFIDNKQKMIAV